MALVTRSADAHFDTVSAVKTPQIPNLSGLVAGEDLDPMAPCYIASDGTVKMSNGTAANAAAAVHGFTGKSYATGEAVTLFLPGLVGYYSDDFGVIDPGSILYVGTTKGRLDTASTTGDTVGVALVLDENHILFIRTKN